MKILLVGSGGREHAMACAIARSPLCDFLWVAPANPGIELLNHHDPATAPARAVPIKANDIAGLVEFARQEKIDLVIAGPEEPLVLGLYDAMTAAGVACLGPSRAAAVLEGSKAAMKKLAAEHHIPTARHGEFTDAATAKKFARTLWQETNQPIVIKTDGLASGKGVIIDHDIVTAEQTIDSILVKKKFGKAGEKIIIEEFLIGRELSYFTLTDGDHGVFLGAAEDHKQAYDNDQGPNTGGMGAFTPSPLLNPDLQKQVEEEIVAPTLAAMKQMGAPYRGILFFGLMVENNRAKLLEINIRLGDPEAVAILQTMQTDLLVALLSAQRGALDDFSIKHWADQTGRPRTALAVVMAAKGYPGEPQRGQKIILPTTLDPDCYIFQAGTAWAEKKIASDKKNDKTTGDIVAAGGRVLTVVGVGDDIATARTKAYGTIEKITFPDSFYRRDIGTRKS